MPSFTILSTVLILLFASLTGAITCDSCGRECAAACGTRNFRTCCFNYLKKRSGSQTVGSEMRLELLMVVPELAQYYSSLRNVLPPETDVLQHTTGRLNLLYQGGRHETTREE